MTVNSQFVAEHIEDVLTALSSGEAVEVSREGQSTLRLTASALPKNAPGGRRVLGAGRGEMRSVSWEEWEQMDRDWKASFLNDSDVK